MNQISKICRGHTLEEPEAIRAIALLQDLGWVVEEQGQYTLGTTLRSFVAGDSRGHQLSQQLPPDRSPIPLA